MIRAQNLMLLEILSMESFSIRSMQSLRDKRKRLFAWSSII